MVLLACSMVCTSRMKFIQLSHLVALSKRYPLILLWVIPTMTYDFQRNVDHFVTLDFIDHDLSLEGSDDVEEIIFERRAQNLCQLPDSARIARWLVLVDQRSSSLEAFTLFVGQDHERFPFAEETQRVIEVDRNTSQFTRVPDHKFLIQLNHNSFLSRSRFRCSDDFLYSSTLKSSCPGTEHLGPLSSRGVIVAEVFWWCLSANDSNPNRASSAPCASGTWAFPLPSAAVTAASARISRSSRICPAFH